MSNTDLNKNQSGSYINMVMFKKEMDVNGLRLGTPVYMFCNVMALDKKGRW
jgi:hypothetical protein